jgi:hypothetical protein
MIVLSKGLANCPVYPAEVVPESPIVGVPGGAAGEMVLTWPSHVVFHPGGPEIYGGGVEAPAFTWLVTCPSHRGTEASSTADAVETTTTETFLTRTTILWLWKERCRRPPPLLATASEVWLMWAKWSIPEAREKAGPREWKNGPDGGCDGHEVAAKVAMPGQPQRAPLAGLGVSYLADDPSASSPRESARL